MINTQLSDSVFIIDGNGKVKLRPEMTSIALFKKIWTRDTGSKRDADGRKKYRAKMELSWIYHTVSHKSPYAAYSGENRDQVVMEAIFTLDGYKWKPDKLVLAARDHYREITTSPTIKLLNTCINTINKTGDFLDGIDFDLKKDNGEPIFGLKSVKDIMNNMKQVADLHKSLNSLKDQVAKEEENRAGARRNVQTNKYNQ